MTKTKIEWCDFTWNPVWGCRNHCSYCYARKIAQRFGESFELHWKEKNFNRKFPTKPSRIFVNSMSDIAFWEDIWLIKVLDKIVKNPQHTFLFLTKQPECYQRFDVPSSDNCWFGMTITKRDFPQMPISEGHINFISIEPIHEQINLHGRQAIQYLNWVIIGAETGNRRAKVIPKRAWIEEIVEYCRAKQIPVFLKNNLQDIWGEKLIQEFPETGGELCLQK